MAGVTRRPLVQSVAQQETVSLRNMYLGKGVECCWRCDAAIFLFCHAKVAYPVPASRTSLVISEISDHTC